MTKILNARILASLGMIVFVAAIAISATGAFFSDTETSTGNTFTAGSVTLAINGLSHTYNGNPGNQPTFTQNGFSFALADLKPLDNGTVNYNLTNGSNQAYICAAVVETGNADNGVNDPESDAGDTTDGTGNGELGQFLSFKFGTTTGTLNGAWQSLGTINGSASASTSIEYCFGTYVAGICTPSATNENIAQTDSLTADVQFYAVQTRNNPNFSCSSLPPASGTSTPPVDNEINQADLGPSSWFFYNDTNDTIMSIDQFAGTGGQNHMELVAGEEGAKMVLDTGVNPRYNIATAQFSDLLNTISSLKFRVYDATADGDTPFLQFNVDFATTTVGAGYQGRLTMQPGTGGNAALPASTWTTVDTQGTAMWTWSKFAVGPDLIAATADDNKWPDGNTNQYRSWSSIVAAFPTAKLLSPGSFLGVRTGQPGPAGATNFVSSIEFDGTTYNFEI